MSVPVLNEMLINVPHRVKNDILTNMLQYKLDESQLNMLAHITAGIGHALFAAIIVPFILGLVHLSFVVITLILIESIFCWVVAILLSRKKKK